MFLLVGLGNPGQGYARNRHNIGAMAVDEIVRRHRLSAPRTRTRPHGVFCEGSIEGDKIVTLKTLCYMNESGGPVGAAMRYWRIEPEGVIVFHDDLDLAPGKIRVKLGGGHGGHNGLRSIDSHIGRDYWRVRIGIGHPGDKSRVTGHVLKDFAKADQTWINKTLDAAADALPILLSGDGPGFMTKFALLTQPPKVKSPRPAKTATDKSKEP
jgi:PTH1 family peptidyl-tRNA hydrolase